MLDTEWVDETRKRADRLSGYVNHDLIELMLVDGLTQTDSNHSKKIKEEIESLLQLYEPQAWRSERPLMKAPEQSEVEGDLDFGTVFNGDMTIGNFRLPLDSLTRHIGIYGQTGHGKTTMFYNLQSQLMEADIPFLVFDLKKDTRALVRQYPELVVIPWNEFKWNPLRPPPKMPIKAWWSNLSQIFGYSFGWFVASSNYLQSHLDFLSDRFNETQKLPTMTDLYSSVSTTSESSRRKSEYHDSVENRLHSLVSIFENNLSISEGIPLEEICSKPCVLELNGLRPAEANWLVEVILSWIYFNRMYEDQRGEGLRHLIFIDECHRIFDRSKEYRQTAVEMGTPIISIFPSQFRDFGTGLVFASQQPSQVMNVVHANTRTKICGNLSSGEDIESISQSMGLESEVTDSIHKLKRGQWIVRMSDDYTEPFLVETLDYPVSKEVTNEEISARLQAKFGGFMRTPAPTLAVENDTVTVAPKLLLPQLTKEGWAMLDNILEHPFKGLSTRYKTLQLSGRKALATKEELISKALVNEMSVPFGGHRPVTFLVLTDYATNTLKNLGKDVRLWKHTGHVGFRHQLFCVLIAYTYRNEGYEVSMEKDLGQGRRVDVLVNIGGRRVAIEVELGKDFSIESELRALEQTDELILAIEDKEAFAVASSKSLPKNVRIVDVMEFLKELRANSNTGFEGNRSDKVEGQQGSADSGKKAGKRRN